MELDVVLHAYRRCHRPVPRPQRLPTRTEVVAAKRVLNTTFHPHYRRFLLEVSDVRGGVYEPVTLTNPHAHTYLLTVCHHAWDVWGVPRSCVPICHDNANFYGVLPYGMVHFWPHDAGTYTDERWPSLAAWIQAVLIDEASAARDQHRT